MTAKYILQEFQLKNAIYEQFASNWCFLVKLRLFLLVVSVALLVVSLQYTIIVPIEWVKVGAVLLGVLFFVLGVVEGVDRSRRRRK